MLNATETLSPALPTDIERLALKVLDTATAKDLRITTAESCTGGLLASLLTDVEGCGHCFERGFVTYTDESKTEMLGVSPDVLKRDGAVSHRCAETMLKGALEQSKADVGVSITGFAGRGAAGEEPGLAYIAAGRRSGVVTVTEHHFGDEGRGKVRLHCLRTALQLLLDEISAH